MSALPPSWIEATGRDTSPPPADAPGLLTVLRADLEANTIDGGAARNVLTVRFAAVLWLRLAQALGRVHPLAGSLVKQLGQVLWGCDVAWQADIGPGLILFHPSGVVVGPACRLGPRAVLMQGVTLGSTPDGSPSVGENVFLGPGACVLGNVTVGDDVIVGANAVVVEDVEAATVVGGVPARVLRRRGE